MTYLYKTTEPKIITRMMHLDKITETIYNEYKILQSKNNKKDAFRQKYPKQNVTNTKLYNKKL